MNDGERPLRRGAPVTVRKQARQLRREQTEAEEILWQALRNRQLDGMKFRRQHPLGRFIVDYCCLERRLVIELDGSIHDVQMERDEERSYHLRAEGYTILRFANDHVMRDLHSVLAIIHDDATSPPLPRTGEGVGG
jgi:very-short-patch-repair endonuclease